MGGILFSKLDKLSSIKPYIVSSEYITNKIILINNIGFGKFPFKFSECFRSFMLQTSKARSMF